MVRGVEIVRPDPFWSNMKIHQKKFDVLSVESWLPSNQPVYWHIRFYAVASKKIVAKLDVSGDGRNVLRRDQ